MIADIRKTYNLIFSEAKYADFLADMNQAFRHKLLFRVAETPIFIDRSFKKKLVTASNQIIDFLIRPAYKKLTDRAIPKNMYVPNETEHTLFLALDFAVVKENNEWQPRLIEMQGFPSLFGYQDFLGNKFREYFYSPKGFTNHFGLTSEEYQAELKSVLLHGHDSENVILLEIDPFQQNTSIDFLITEKITGITPVHIGDVERDGRNLYYRKEGKRILIKRIYNRVIFDELIKRTDLKLNFSLTEDVEIEWAGHPNWFFRISKFAMPFINSEYVPSCKFLNAYETMPSDLQNFVLKPLFSFSGSGVIFNFTKKDWDAIDERERGNFILQRKVQYEPVIAAPDGKVKAEIRLLFIWKDGAPRPQLVTNLARLSRGEMVGVKFNKDKTWVGSSICFFEPD